MADVDFSHAVLDVNGSNKPMSTGDYLQLYNGQYFHVGGGVVVNYYNSSMSIITNTPTKVSILYAGSFDISGTGFTIGNSDYWKVSNISYSEGDTYSFIIDIETSGS